MMKIEICRSAIHGMGVVAREPLRANAMIEETVILEIEDKDLPAIQGTKLREYIFQTAEGKAGIALGMMSMANHSHNPNAEWFVDKGMIRFFARVDIRPNQEITINYGDYAKVLGLA